jgi:hypothetical protein
VADAEGQLPHSEPTAGYVTDPIGALVFPGSLTKADARLQPKAIEPLPAPGLRTMAKADWFHQALGANGF